MTLGLYISSAIVVVVAVVAGLCRAAGRTTRAERELTLKQRKRIASHLRLVNGGGRK